MVLQGANYHQGEILKNSWDMSNHQSLQLLKSRNIWRFPAQGTKNTRRVVPQESQWGFLQQAHSQANRKHQAIYCLSKKYDGKYHGEEEKS